MTSPGSGRALEQVVIDATGINEVDSSALHALKELIDEYKSRDIQVIFANVKGPVRDMFNKSGPVDIVGEEKFTWISIKLFPTWIRQWRCPLI